MGENEVERLKALTLDMLCGAGGAWHSFAEIECDFRVCDGDVDAGALETAIDELVDEGKIEHEERHCKDEYRWAPPQKGENLADKVKRLEGERDAALADKAYLLREFDAARNEWLDYLTEIERALRLHDGESALDAARRIRAEQAADRAAVRALVDVLPQTIGLIDPVAKFLSRTPWETPLRALQVLMATWPSGAGRHEVDDAETTRAEEKTSKREAFIEMARRCGDPGTSMLAVGSALHDSDSDDCQAGSDNPAQLERIKAEASADPDGVERDRERMRQVLRSASEKVAAWPDYLHSDDVKRRRDEFAKRCERLGISSESAARDTFSFVMPEDGIVRTSFNSETGEAKAMHMSTRFDGERPLAVTYPHRRPRYIGEFGDIDEPSVGDVDGYGRGR